MMVDIAEKELFAGVLREIYRVAESIYLAGGWIVPDGGQFARSINEHSEHCYHAAVVAYYGTIANHAEGPTGKRFIFPNYPILAGVIRGIQA